METYGQPIALYIDKHGAFRVNRPDAVGGDGFTQYGRVPHNLNIDLICANSSQAKGRVERANKTLQDRLVKELRLAGISNMDDGNAVLPSAISTLRGHTLRSSDHILQHEATTRATKI